VRSDETVDYCRFTEPTHASNCRHRNGWFAIWLTDADAGAFERLTGNSMPAVTMSIPKEKHKPTQLVVSAIFGAAVVMPCWGLWRLAVSDTTAIWPAASSAGLLAIAFYWWYGYMQKTMQE
jgi:hypothetical protein